MQAKASDPIALLRDMEQRARGGNAAQALARGAGDVWRGIGFRLDEQHLVSAMADVLEVLHCPRLARVPGAKEWLLGIANLRGALLPVVDMHGFLRGRPGAITRDSRVLVIGRDDLLTGLLVDEVYGVKHFPKAGRTNGADVYAPWLAAYVTGSFREGEGRWLEFDVHALTQSPEFMQVAA
ncbi:MAG: chemotaxis protein CheW [Gammaproteobacteria bacterium]|nr:chemotaxis protein CheW [Gammaproteobacteria bacterium]